MKRAFLLSVFVLCVAAGPPLPPGSPVRSPRDAGPRSGSPMSASSATAPPAANGLYSLSLSGSGFALTFRTNVPACTVLCGTNLGRWVAARRLTNAPAGIPTPIGCPWTNRPRVVYFKVVTP